MNLPVAFLLPYPPSDNKRYLYLSKRLTPETRHYRYVEVAALAKTNGHSLNTITERIQAVVYLYPCNNRRDATNCLKELWDSLQANKIIKNDNLIDDARVVRSGNHPSDIVFVELWPVGFEPKGVATKKTIEHRCSSFPGQVFSSEYVRKFIERKEKVIQ